MVGCLLDSFRDVPFRIKFASVLDSEFLSVLLGLILYPFAPFVAPLGDVLDIFAALLSGLLLVVQLERIVPFVLVEIQQHLLLEFVCSVVDINGVIVFVQAFVHGLDGGFVQVTVHRCGLPRFVGSTNSQQRVDESKSVDYHLSSHRLDRINNHCYALRVQLLKGLLNKRLFTCVLMSTLDSQHPKEGWEWYQPTTTSVRWVCLSISSISC